MSGILFDRRAFVKIAGLTAGALAIPPLRRIAAAAARESYPKGKITLIVPNKPGGGYDIFARVISPYVTKYLKNPAAGATGGEIVVKNEPASSGRKGLAMIFNAPRHGYTIGIMDSGVITDDILGQPEYDYGKFTFLSQAVKMSPVIVTSKKGYHHWQEVMSEMKKGPVKIAVGSFARTNHAMCILATEMMKANFKIINFPGTMEAANALMRGDVHLFFGAEDAVRPLVEAGELRPVLTFTANSGFPGVSTVKDVGFPDLLESLSSARFLIAPPGIEAEPRRLLIAALQKADKDDKFAAWAKQNKANLAHLYGNEAGQAYQNLAKFYADNTAIFKKYLK